jgi:hypothetical protein
MPFKSEKQRKFMWAKHPDIARRWTEKYGSKIRAGAARARKRKSV